jgi:hypothetical protein
VTHLGLNESTPTGLATALQWSRDAIYPLMEVAQKIVHVQSSEVRVARCAKIIQDFVSDFKNCFTRLVHAL